MLVIDISNVNGPVDWARVAKQGIHAAFLKVTEGRTWVDATFDKHRTAAAKVGIHVGGYHFARPDHNDPISEARNFAHALGKIRAGELRPVLDFETPSHLTSSQLNRWVRSFNQEVKRLTGVCPIFYSYPSFISGMRLSKPVGCGLWLASYDRNDGKEHPFTVPAPWKKVVAHQFSSRCRVGGCSGFVDLSSAKSINPLLAHPVRGRVAKLLYRRKRPLP